MKNTQKISLFFLVLLIVSAIDSIRNLPSAALFGSSLIFYFLFSALIFLVPTALVSAHLSSLYPDKGGVYVWMTKAFGEKIGMLSIWLQWINTMVWYPTILSFIAGVGAYLINPALADNKLYLICVILTVFWGLTFLNLFGMKTSAIINSICGLIGTLLPLGFLIIAGLSWKCLGECGHLSFKISDLLPTLAKGDSWISLTAIMASFLGIELAGVHIHDIKNPRRNFPLAMLYSSLILIFTMLFGSLAIAYILPAEKINLVSGVMQTFTNIFEALHIGWATPLLGLLILIGSIGSIINWLISPAKGLYHAAEYGFLPDFFKKKNKHDVPSRILIGQALLVSLFCLALFLVPTVNAFYWFLTGLSTDLYIFMYILMFISAIKLHHTHSEEQTSFRIPGKTLGLWLTCSIGLFGCLLTLAVGFFPPPHLLISTKQYAFFILVGNLSMVSPVFLFYLFKKSKNKQIIG